MGLLVDLEGGLVVELLWTEVALEPPLLVGLLALPVTVQVGDVGVPLQVQPQVSPEIYQPKDRYRRYLMKG